jgi:hypothetical protein
MNPKTNKFEELSFVKDDGLKKQFIDAMTKLPEKFVARKLLRPNGEPVPEHWSVFKENEKVVVKNYTFEVVRVGENYMVLEPVGPVSVGENKE